MYHVINHTPSVLKLYYVFTVYSIFFILRFQLLLREILLDQCLHYYCMNKRLYKQNILNTTQYPVISQAQFVFLIPFSKKIEHLPCVLQCNFILNSNPETVVLFLTESHVFFHERSYHEILKIIISCLAFIGN